MGSFDRLFNFEGDLIMDRIASHFQMLLIGFFLVALDIKILEKSTIEETLHQVGACFRSNFRDDATKGRNWNRHPLISLQLKGYNNIDPLQSSRGV